MSWLSRITGRDAREAAEARQRAARVEVEAQRVRQDAQDLRRRLAGARKQYSAIMAAANSPAQGGWSGIRTAYDEDATNKEYLFALAEVQGRSQDLDANNPDVHGFNRSRTAQIVGKGVRFKHVPHAAEIGLEADEAVQIGGQIDRLRQIHSRTGGFDSTDNNRSEGTQQVRAVLTTLISGCCLIHRVWRDDRRGLGQFSLELIDGKRISTPYELSGSPLVSYGVQYSDDHRTRVIGFHVRRVSKTHGNSFEPDVNWDFLPIEDCSLMSLTEMAGLDRSLPLTLPVVRMLRNRGEFIEAAVESARAQANIYAVQECAPGEDPWLAASDDQDQLVQSDGPNGNPLGFVNLGGVQMMYTANGQTVNWNSAKLPEPEFKDFMDVTDQRVARGLVSSLSRFTRKVTSSWAGGRLEDQQDDPIIDQLREMFCAAWQKVNEWFLEAVWLTGAIELPGYNAETAPLWAEFRATFPGKLHINESESMKARQIAYMLRSKAPQHGCEEDGTDLREIADLWGEAMGILRAAEKKHELPEHSLDILLEGKSLTTDAGAQIAPPPPQTDQEEQGGQDEGGGEGGGGLRAA